jgi:hypothetical protein
MGKSTISLVCNRTKKGYTDMPSKNGWDFMWYNGNIMGTS